MRITAIEMTSFRSGFGATLGMDARRVLVAGRNGSGKSTCRELVRWVLTGRCDLTDGKGAGAEKLIPTNGQSVEGAVTIAGLGTVRRKRERNVTTLTVEGFSGDSTAQQAALYDRLGTTQAYLDAVLDTGHFLGLHHAEAKALIMGLLNVTVEVDGSVCTLEQLDALYADAFESRKLAKAKARGFTVPLAPELPPGVSQMPDLQTIETLLNRLRGELETSAGQGGQTAGKMSALVGELARLRRQTPFVGSIPEPAVREKIAHLEEQIAGLEALQAARPTATVTVPVPVPDSGGNLTAEQVTVYRNAIDVLTAHKPKGGCVLDPSVPCETSKHKFNYRVKALQEILDAQPKAPETVQEPLGAERDLSGELRAHRAELQSLRLLEARYAEAAIVERDLQTRMVEIETELAALPDTKVHDEAVGALRARVQKGEAMLTKARTYWAAVDIRAKALVEQGKLNQAVTDLEARCEALGPNGLRLHALQNAIGTFEGTINAILGRFGWTLNFQIDPWGVTVNKRPVETYSESEQFRIGIALQLALAESSGLSFAVIDRLDMLDVGNRRAVQETIFGASTGQILVLSTREPEQPLPPAKPGLIAYRLDLVDGYTVVVEAARDQAA